MRYLIGMDLGTTNLKGVLYREDGEKIASASRTYETIYQPGNGVEQRPSDWWNAATEVFREITGGVSTEIRAQIQAICVSAQTPTLLPVDEAGTPLRNAIIWMDRRAEAELVRILERIGEQRYIAITGMQPDASFLPAKLLWYRHHEPELFEKTACFLQASSFINYRLTGNLSMDMDQASLTQLLDINAGRFSGEIGAAIGIDVEDYFPRPMPNNEVIGRVSKEAADQAGLQEGIMVVAGTSDAIAAMYASGMTQMGEATEVSGTSSLVFAGTHTLPQDYHTVSGHACALKGIPYVFNAPISATGASIKWYLQAFGEHEARMADEQGVDVYHVLNEEAALSPPGSNGLMFFPYLMGERAPLWNGHARGMFIGLTADTGRTDMVRAIFEGTAFALKSVIEEFKRNGTRIDRLRCVGGGAGSETWLRIKASVLNVPVLVLDAKTGDVPFGDALIAGSAARIYEDVSKSIAEIVRTERVIEPNVQWVRRYEALYPFFRKLYLDLDQDLADLAANVKILGACE